VAWHGTIVGLGRPLAESCAGKSGKAEPTLPAIVGRSAQAREGRREHLFGASEHYQTDISKIIRRRLFDRRRVTGQRYLVLAIFHASSASLTQ
jgi:hypothetical protein